MQYSSGLYFSATMSHRPSALILAAPFKFSGEFCSFPVSKGLLNSGMGKPHFSQAVNTLSEDFEFRMECFGEGSQKGLSERFLEGALNSYGVAKRS